MKRLPFLVVLGTVVVALLMMSAPRNIPPQMVEAAPTPSGAKLPYPANFNFDAWGDGEVGTPPSNFDFETDPQQVGTPPTNYDFETGDFTGWTTSGTTSVQSGGPSGYYARLGSSGTITSSAFTIPSNAQSLQVDMGTLGTGTNAYYIYILSGPNYSTQTTVKYYYCSSCAGQWTTVEIDPTTWRGQSVKLKVSRYVTGTIGVDNAGISIEVLVDWASEGMVTRASCGGSYGESARITKDITSSAFSVDDSAQVASLKAALQGATGNSFKVLVLSGQGYGTQTEVVYVKPSSSQGWAEYKFGVGDWAGESIKLKVDWIGGTICVDEAGVASEVVEAWSPSGTGVLKIQDDPDAGSYMKMDGEGPLAVTSGTFEKPPGLTPYSITYKFSPNIGDNGINYGSAFRVKWNGYIVFQDGRGPVGGDTDWIHNEFLLYSAEATEGEFTFEKIIGFSSVKEIGGNIVDWHIYPPPPPPPPPSVDPPDSYTRDPVSLITGTFHHQHTDLYVPGREVPLEFTRHYDSQMGYRSALGHRWTHNYAMRVNGTSNNDVEVRYQTGRLVRFASGGGGYVAPAGVLDTLVKNGDNTWTLTTKQQVRYKFDTSGKLASIVDRNDNATILTYTSGRLTSVTDSDGRSLTLTYDGNGRISEVTDPLDRTVEYEYDASGDLVSVTNVRGDESTFTYSHHRLLTGTDTRENTFVTNVYDHANRVVQQTDAMDNVTFIDYSAPDVGATRMTDARNNTTTYYFDSDYRITDVEDDEGGVVHYAYDSANNITSVTDPNDNTTSLTYDDAGNVLTATNALDETWTFTYNSNNDLLTVTDPLSRETTYEYDGSGNLTSITNALDQETVIARGDNGEMTSITDPEEHTTTFDYDDYGNLIDITDPLENSVTIAYDLGGRITSFTDQRDETTSYTYDDANNLLTVTDPLSHVTTLAYDAKGNLTSATDANENVTTFAYDELDRLITVTDALEQVTTYGYNALGNLTSVLNARDKTTTYSYDALNRLTEETDPLDRSRAYAYDDAGRLTSRTDAKDQETTYEYDDANRLTDVTYPVGSVALTYDDVGNVLTMVDSTGTSTYTYDDLNRVLSATTPGPDTMSYTYDSGGNLETITYPGDNEVTYDYDDADRLTDVTDWLTNTTTYTYDDAGNVLTANFPNDVTATYTYDDAGRLTSVVNTLDQTTLSSYSYTLDDVGNRTEIEDLSGTTSYTYDDLYRLTGGTYPNDDEVSYVYDANGNRTSMTVNGGTPTSYTYDDADQMTQAGGMSYTYDDNGNLTDRGDDTFSYDYENRLVEATVGETTASFTYNGAGRRVSKTVGANTTDYLWSNVGSLPVVLYDGNYYVYGRGLIAKTDSQSNQLYYLTDGLGSTTGLADYQGDVVGTYTYDVFGAIRSETGGQANDFKFTGQQLDNETDFYYLRARYYDPSVGRFLTRDPFAGLVTIPESLNRYAYVMNNPALYVDPLGFLGNPVGWARDRAEEGWHATGNAAGQVGEFVNEHVVQPTVDFLSDPENVLSVIQTGSGIVAQVACKGGGVVCAAALTVYVTASIGKAFIAETDCEALVAGVTAAFGYPRATGVAGKVLAGLSGAIDGVGCATPAHAYARSNSKE